MLTPEQEVQALDHHATQIAAAVAGDPYVQEWLRGDGDSDDNNWEIIDKNKKTAGNSNSAHRVDRFLTGRPATDDLLASGEVRLTPSNPQQFNWIVERLEGAHIEGNTYTNGLLQAIKIYIATTNKVGKRKTPMQSHALHVWWRPLWAPMTAWDAKTQTVVNTGITEAQRKEHKHAAQPTKTQRLQQEISDKLHLTTTDGEPDPRLGTVASPTHGDHPLVWIKYLFHICKQKPRGLSIGPLGYVYQRHIQGFYHASYHYSVAGLMLCLLITPNWLRSVCLQGRGVTTSWIQHHQFYSKLGTY